MTIYSRLKTLSNDRCLKYAAIATTITVALSLLSSALSFVTTTVMVLLIAALLIKLLWEISSYAQDRTY
jgi:uncharacterized membrane protein